jgi:hypothetical protein
MVKHNCDIQKRGEREMKKKLKPMTEYVNDIMNYVILSFDFIRNLPPSILIQEDSLMIEISKSKNLVLDDLAEILKLVEEKGKC